MRNAIPSLATIFSVCHRSGLTSTIPASVRNAQCGFPVFSPPTPLTNALGRQAAASGATSHKLSAILSPLFSGMSRQMFSNASKLFQRTNGLWECLPWAWKARKCLQRAFRRPALILNWLTLTVAHYKFPFIRHRQPFSAGWRSQTVDAIAAMGSFQTASVALAAPRWNRGSFDALVTSG